MGATILSSCLSSPPFFHTQILGLGVHYVHMIGTVEHIHIITLSTLLTDQFGIEGIAIVQDGTAFRSRP